MPDPSQPHLAERLLDIAYDIAATSGPAAVSLREVQRRAGVSAATAYWHYTDRAALLLAVSRRATAALADALEDALGDAPGDRAGAAPSDVSAVCLAYLHFARDHRGLFEAVVLNSSIEELMHPADPARGRSGLAAFEVLRRAVAAVRTDGGSGSGSGTDDTSIHVWAATHGMAVLLVDTPMADLPEAEKERLRRQHVGFVLGSLAGPRGEGGADPL